MVTGSGLLIWKAAETAIGTNIRNHSICHAWLPVSHTVRKTRMLHAAEVYPYHRNTFPVGGDMFFLVSFMILEIVSKLSFSVKPVVSMIGFF